MDAIPSYAVLRDLTARLDALEEDNALLRAQVMALAAQRNATMGMHGEAPTPPAEPSPQVSRWTLLRVMLGAVAAGRLLTPPPAEAEAGSKAPTSFSSSGHMPAVQTTNTSDGPGVGALSRQGDAVQATAQVANKSGVFGLNKGMGYGVTGSSVGGYGVYASSNNLAPLLLNPRSVTIPPPSGTYHTGALLVTATGDLYICINGDTGAWGKVQVTPVQ